ncbi:Crp/Fnr family transcriptional regulator [Marinobacterium arenosum]|uniref:Crp/Fnr family transcriptional regulator n=1 Tax=Marinobacterium arenosum TaxID=2862496 RepID=UPI001C93DE0F|nr:Crp/Fnr family transcriptional regulator [Marinobacterium arenosum]MBY4676675.1 Crp/Fnr family transcriptional regulator [Marinobacterium arenosum]
MQQVDSGLLLGELGIDYFKGASTLGALSDQAIEALLAKGRVYALSEGETLFEAGSRGDAFFVLLKGSVSYYHQLDDRCEHIRDFQFGEQIGFVSMVALQPRPGKAIATCDSYALEVSNELFYALHCDMPLDFGLLLMNLSREMARSIVTLNTTLADMKKERGSDSG